MLLSHSVEETIFFGKQIGSKLPLNSIVCFKGDLGAGKTTLIKGIALGAGFPEQEEVNSPTFVYLNIYQGVKPIYHFDLYRLQSGEEFLNMGFDEYLYADGICCIEWFERIEHLLPEQVILIEMRHREEGCREIQVTSHENII